FAPLPQSVISFREARSDVMDRKDADRKNTNSGRDLDARGLAGAVAVGGIDLQSAGNPGTALERRCPRDRHPCGFLPRTVAAYALQYACRLRTVGPVRGRA